MTDEVRLKAFAMFAEGRSVNAVASALFKGGWIAAKKAKTEWESHGGASEVAPARPRKPGGGKKKKRAKHRASPELEEPDEPQQFELQIDVPTEQLDGVFQRFTSQEKANAVQFILQERMDAMLAGD